MADVFYIGSDAKNKDGSFLRSCAVGANVRTCVLEDVETRFRPVELLAERATSSVVSCKDLLRHDPCALKSINIHSATPKRKLRESLRELVVQRHIKHENVLRLRTAWLTRPRTVSITAPVRMPFRMHPVDTGRRKKICSLYLVTDLFETDLKCVIRSAQALTEDHVQYFVYQMLRGLKAIHSAGVLHGQVNARNLLVNSNCDLAIADFGAAVVLPPSGGVIVSDPDGESNQFCCPEALQNLPQTQAVDIFAVGCMMAELYLRKPLFRDRGSAAGKLEEMKLMCLGNLIANSHDADVLRRELAERLRERCKLKDDMSDLERQRAVVVRILDTDMSVLPKVLAREVASYMEARCTSADLLAWMLSWHPQHRPTATQALAHPYLHELHDESDEPTCERIPVPEVAQYFVHDPFLRFVSGECVSSMAEQTVACQRCTFENTGPVSCCQMCSYTMNNSRAAVLKDAVLDAEWKAQTEENDKEPTQEQLWRCLEEEVQKTRAKEKPAVTDMERKRAYVWAGMRELREQERQRHRAGPQHRRRRSG